MPPMNTPPSRLAAIGNWLRRWLGRPPAGPASLTRPIIRRGLRTTSLQFTRDEAQSRMLTFDPDRLLIDYTRTMMGCLLFIPSPRRIGMVGLGGGSLVKFCHRHLPDTAVEVVEISAEVIALRRTFRIPRDDARLRVVHGDGAEFVRQHLRRFDVLLVDGYDASGIPPALASQGFYDDCRRALDPAGGVLVVNLFCDDAGDHIARLRRSFGKSVLVVREGRQSNRVAFAWVGHPVARREFQALQRRMPATLPAAAREQLLPAFDAVAAAARQQLAG